MLLSTDVNGAEICRENIWIYMWGCTDAGIGYQGRYRSNVRQLADTMNRYLKSGNSTVQLFKVVASHKIFFSYRNSLKKNYIL